MSFLCIHFSNLMNLNIILQGVLFSLVANGWQYDKLGVLEQQSFNLPQWTINIKIFILSTFSPIYYIVCYLLVLFYSNIFIIFRVSVIPFFVFKIA